MSSDLIGRADWFKSSYSQHAGECVEIAHLDGGMIGVRDSKDSTGPALLFSPGEWDTFTACLEVREVRFT